MKKLILVMVSCAAFAIPANGATTSNPAAADWKEEVIDILFARAEKVMKRIDSFDAELDMAFVLHSAVAGFCSGAAWAARTPTPESAIEMSVRIHKIFMSGQIPAVDDIRELGLQCVTHIENIWIKNGASEQDLERLASMMKKMILAQLNRIFGEQ